MIEKMEKIFIYGLSEDGGQMVSDLMECGCLQIVHPKTMAGFEEIRDEMAQHAAGLYDSEQLLARLGASISALSPYFPKKKLLDKRPGVGFGQLAQKTGLSRALELCSAVEEIQQDIAGYKAEESKTAFLKTSLEPWQNFDLPLEVTHTRECDIFLLVFSAGETIEGLKKAIEEASLSAILTEVSRDADQLYAAVVCHKCQSAQLWELVRQEGAAKVCFDQLSGTAVQNIAKAEQALQKLEKSIEEATDKLRQTAADGFILKEAYDSVQMEIECGKAKSNMLHTEATYLLAAWVPQRKKAKVEKTLEKYPCYYEFHQPDQDELPPVLLKNNKLVEPFEAVTEMYALPMYGSLDADPFLAPFFFIFFGMMLSDAGYGLLLVLGGFLGAKLLDLGPGGKKMFRLIGLGGISTVIFGALYGSWFGDAIPKIAEVFFGKDITIPLLIDPLSEPLTILAVSFILGYIHIFVGLALKATLLIRRGKALDAFFDVGMWAIVLLGLPMLAATAGESFLGATLASQISTVGMWLSLIGVAGLILTQGRDKKNPFMKLMGGVMSLYDITGYFSDLLSYSRILALGLATGVIATVVNQIGTLMGGGIISAILFVAIFVFGHAMNLAINALGSYVHAARLQYVEFFGKFYEGGGKPFAPLAPHTKYVMISKQEEK